jgi:hypothetical protein
MSILFGLVQSAATEGLFWFRIAGIGLHFKRIDLWPLLYSERNGYWRRWQFGRWSVGYLSRLNSNSRLNRLKTD